VSKSDLYRNNCKAKFQQSTLTNILGELKKHQARPKLAKFVSRGVEDLNKLDRSVDNLEKRLLRVRQQDTVTMQSFHNLI
jgi:hypothetical protein